MKLNVDFIFNDHEYPKGSDVPWYLVYPFFIFHIFIFGCIGFWMAYYTNPVTHVLMFLHGGIAIFVYIKFYKGIFGSEAIKWMIINAILGMLAVWGQLGWILSFLLGKEINDFPIYVHIIPGVYFIIYTFLIRQAILDITNSREHKKKKIFIESAYVVIIVSIFILPQHLT